MLDEANNQLHVLAEREQMQQIEQVVAELDVAATEGERHLIELVNLLPSRVAQMIEPLLTGGGGSPSSGVSSPSGRIRGRLARRGGGSTTTVASGGSDVQIIPLDEAQLLIVICSEEDWVRVEQTIKLWDERAVSNTPHLETVEIKQGDPQTIADTLNGLYRGGYTHPTLGAGSQLIIQAEGRSILLYAVQPAIEEILPLIEALDTEDGRQYEILPLAHADASDVAQRALSLFGGGGGGGRRIRSAGGAGGDVVVEAETSTNSLIVQADAVTLERIKDFAMEVDQRAGEQLPERRFFTLKYATPRDVAQAVAAMFVGGTGRRFQGAAMGQQIKAVMSGSQVVVEAPRDKMGEIEAFIAQLDDPKGNEIVIKTVKLPGADVAQIASKLSNAFREKSNVVARFDPDAQAETIVLTCTRDALEEAERLIGEYAEAQKGVTPQVEFRQMTYAQATDAANWLREQLITYMQQQLGRSAAAMIKVTADARTNRVVINGPEVAVKYGMNLLNQFDVAATEPPVTAVENAVRKFAGLDVRTLASNLTTTFRNQPPRPDRLSATFSADPTTETLIISAPKDMFPEIDKIIAAYEEETKELEPAEKFVQVEHADANYVANQVRQILTTQVSRTRGRAVLDRISVLPETRLNQIVLNVPQFVMPMAESLIAKLDQPPIADTQLRTITLESADANAVLNVLRTIFQEKIRARTLQISVEPMTNSLIIGGSKEDYEDIEQWAKDLDDKTIPKGGELRIVDVMNANPWEIVGILNTQFGARRYGQKNRVGQEFTFQVVSGRSIVVLAPQDKIDEVVALIQKIDEVGSNEVEVRTYVLAGMGNQLNSLASQVRDGFNSTVEAREQRIAVNAYPTADALIITARADQFDRIESMMDQFKELVTAVKSKTEFFALEYVDANQIVNLVRDMVQKRVQTGGRRGGQDFSVSADPRTNRLIVFAPEVILPDVEAVVKELDVSVPDDNVVTLVLKHADPWETRNMINDVFGYRGSKAMESSAQQVYVTVNNSTLIIKAPPKKLEQIQELVAKIDAPDETGLQIKTYQLKVLNATQVAVAGPELLAEHERRNTEWTDAAGRVRRADHEYAGGHRTGQASAVHRNTAGQHRVRGGAIRFRRTRLRAQERPGRPGRAEHRHDAQGQGRRARGQRAQPLYADADRGILGHDHESAVRLRAGGIPGPGRRSDQDD